MHADVQHLRVRLKDVLGPVAVVDIPVNDEHAFQAKVPYGILGGNGHVVEDAEAVRLIRLRVMSRRPDIADAAARLAAQHALHRLQHGAGGQGGAVEGARMQIH